MVVTFFGHGGILWNVRKCGIIRFSFLFGFQLSESVRSSLKALILAFLERFQKRTTHFDINLFNRKQYMEETVDDYMARVSRLTTEYELPTHLLVGITIQGLKPDLRQIVMPQSPVTFEKIRQLALVSEQTLKSTGVANTSIAASLQQLEDKLLSSFSEKLEASAAVISSVNSNLNDQSHEFQAKCSKELSFKSF